MKLVPDNRLPSVESVMRVAKPLQVKMYVPPAQATTVVLPSLWVVVLLGFIITVTPLDQSQLPTMRPQAPAGMDAGGPREARARSSSAQHGRR